MFLKSLWLVALTAATLFMTACEDTPVDPELVAPDAPTAIMATSASETEIFVKWTKATTGQAPTGYVIVVAKDGGSNAQEIDINDPATTNLKITGLTEGSVYQFYVYAVNDTAKSSPTATIKWAPAKRYTTNLRVYETESKNFGSGIELPNAAGLFVSEGGRWDLCLDTRSEIFDIGSPTLSSYVSDTTGKFKNGDTPRITTIGKIWQNVSSLDEIYEAVALNDDSNPALTEKLLNFNKADSTGSSFAFVARTAAGNYAKVLVKSNGGKLLQGTSPDRYVDLEISYQTGANIPYAITARSESSPFTKKTGEVVETNVKKAE